MKNKIILLTALLSLASCKVTKENKLDYEYNGDTYAKTEYVHDTTFVDRIEYKTIWDTAYLEMDAETDIYFTEGGGTYNEATGEMTGVLNIRTTEREKSLQKRVESLATKEDSMASVISLLTDSLSNVQAHEVSEEHTEKKTRSLWWMWLTIGLVAGAVGIIALKKSPLQNPL